MFPVGPYTFRGTSRSLYDPATAAVIKLTEKEAPILKFLFRARCQLVPREVLLEQVWGMVENVTTHTVETHVYRLRKKL